MPNYAYPSSDNPLRWMDLPTRQLYEDNPRMVFTNWLTDIGAPGMTRERIQGLLYDRLFADWYRKLITDPLNGPQWFGDYLYGQNPRDLERALAGYSFQARGYNPSQYVGRVRWLNL